MHVVKPKIFVIAETAIDMGQVGEMLYAVGMPSSDAIKWRIDHHPEEQKAADGEVLAEVMGRLCYKSFTEGLNKNVTRVRTGIRGYIGNILNSKHGSVLEHATTSVAFIGVTRVFTHEMVRHRPGNAFSQESLRYVRLEDIGMRVPQLDDQCINEIMQTTELNPEVKIQGVLDFAFQKIGEYAEEIIGGLVKDFGLDGMKNFDIKKKITSILRRLAPEGLATNIGVTGNHRAWRYEIEQRTSIHAEEEIREVFGMVAKEFSKRYPNFYQDMLEHADGSFTFENSKI